MEGNLLRMLFAFAIFFNLANSQSTEVTSETTMTTQLPATTIIRTTTTAPLPPPTTIPPNTDLAHCLCDLTQDACDVDCCCDAACSASDRLAFSRCIDQSVPVDTQSCIQSSMVFRNNTPYQVNETVPGLFCVYTNNNPEANYYNVPVLINTDEAFSGNVSIYGSYGFASKPLNSTVENTQYYKSGDPIYAVYEILTYDFLRLPLKSTSSACVFSPVPFLYGQKASCSSIRKDELASKCQDFTVIDARTYFQNFKVAATPQAIVMDNTTNAGVPVLGYNSSLLIPVVVDSVLWCLDESGYNHTCSFSSPPPPQYSSSDGVCRNAVVQVIYSIEYNGTSGIAAVNVSFTFQNITAAHLPFMQTFQTSFFKVGEDTSLRFSGNPGYIGGEPVVAGTLATNTTADRVAIILDSDRTNWMTILSPQTDGLCNRASRSSVLFNEGLRSGCFVTFSLQNMSGSCNQTAYQVLSTLRGPKPPTYVASFGNTPVTSVGDWVKIIDNPPTLNVYSASTGECNNFPTGMNIQIIYANVGAINNPQPQIIGVKYEYVIQPSVRFQCNGPYCNPSSMDRPQKFEISSSVTFIDASSPAVGSYGAIPQGAARLPADFFYPLT